MYAYVGLAGRAPAGDRGMHWEGGGSHEIEISVVLAARLGLGGAR
jgi:hypothetical protein